MPTSPVLQKVKDEELPSKDSRAPFSSPGDEESEDGQPGSFKFAVPASTDKTEDEFTTLRYHLLGPSLTKAGQDSVDQQKVSEIIFNASKGSKYFNNEQIKDKILTQKIERILIRKRQLDTLDLSNELKKADEYIRELEASRDLTQHVVHIDCDAFYAAVEELDRPELKSVPFAVGKGVLTTCNYVARKYGCRSGMAGFVAKKLCPELECLPLKFSKYTAKAKEVRQVLAEYDPRFESAGMDEAYLNITEYCLKNGIEPEEAVQQLRARVFDHAKITVSAGIAANAKIAKIASDKNKPNGQFSVANDRDTILAFMKELPTRKVNGVGRVFERELDAIGIKTCGNIYDSRAYLTRLFGEKAFQFLIHCYLGLGRTSIRPAEEYERKSVGTESTFRDMDDPVQLRQKLRKTAEELEGDLMRTQFKGKTLVLKIKLHTYEVFTRQVVLPKPLSAADDLYRYALPMFSKLQRETPRMKLRLMGLRCTNLVSTKKIDIDFFGARRQIAPKDDHAPTSYEVDAGSDGEWEKWPEETFEESARLERLEEMNETERLSQEDKCATVAEPSENNLVLRASPDKVTVAPTTWDCPICDRPQDAEDRTFNAHIDSCLSRQTIKDAVRASSDISQEPNLTGVKDNETSSALSKKRKDVRPTEDKYELPKKTRVFFKARDNLF